MRLEGDVFYRVVTGVTILNSQDRLELARKSKTRSKRKSPDPDPVSHGTRRTLRSRREAD